MTSIRTPLRHRRLGLAALAVSTGLLATACGSQPTSSTASSNPERATTSTAAPEEHEAHEQHEVAHLAPRALVTGEDGLVLIDTESGEVVATEPLEGFLRLADAGDGRHVVVSDTDQFRVYDTGISAEAHGDHAHYFEAPAALTERTFASPGAGHVVVHERLTNLFSDGTGTVQVVESGRIADPAAPVRTHSTPAPHHGVAVELFDGTVLTTHGTEDERTGVQLLAGEEVVAETTECPGVHGEAMAKPVRPGAGGEVAVLGCENGAVVLRDGAFHPVAVSGPVRTGTLVGHPGSTIVLADHKTDPDAEHERPTAVALIDSRRDRLRTVELGSSYWFRSLARGPHGEALVLTYDGSLRVIDPKSGRQTDSIDVISPWREKDDWQQPGPILKVAGELAYVTDAEKAELVVVDLHSGEVVNRIDLASPAGELAVTTGIPAWEAHTH